MGDLLRNGFEDLTGTSSATSAVFSFTTVPGPGDCPVGSNATVVFSDNMEAGAPGWTNSAVTGTNSWALSTAFPASPVNAYRGIGPVTVSDQRLVSPAISVPATGASRALVFKQRIGLEPRSGGGCWDAGILEVSTDAGATFTQVTAGITGVPYTGAVQGTTPVVQGWCGDTTAHQTTAVDLAPYTGQSVQFRFKLTSDSSISVASGWNIDDVKVQTCSVPGAAGK